MVTLEGLGIPTALIATPKFENSARVHAKVFGMPDYKPIYLDFGASSIAGHSPERIEEFAERLADEVIAVLSGKAHATSA